MMNRRQVLGLIGCGGVGLTGLARALGNREASPVIAASKNPFDELPEVTNYAGLEIGRSYYLVDQPDRVYPQLGVRKQVSECQSSGMWTADLPTKCFNGRIWAMDDNPQAFQRWKIYGPISTDWITT